MCVLLGAEPRGLDAGHREGEREERRDLRLGRVPRRREEHAPAHRLAEPEHHHAFPPPRKQRLQMFGQNLAGGIDELEPVGNMGKWC